MAYYNIIFTLLIAFSCMQFLSSGQDLPASSISAAPALLPDSAFAPSAAPPPALSPDITPLFPSPGGSELSPSDSSVPLIPSSPSPPNPDDVVAPGPGLAPDDTVPNPDSSAVRLDLALVTQAAVAICWWLLLGMQVR